MGFVCVPVDSLGASAYIWCVDDVFDVLVVGRVWSIFAEVRGASAEVLKFSGVSLGRTVSLVRQKRYCSYYLLLITISPRKWGCLCGFQIVPCDLACSLPREAALSAALSLV